MRIGEVRTALVWPNGVAINPEMLSLIYAGFGARKGWPATVPPMSPDAPFPVPPLEQLGVVTYGRSDPGSRAIAGSDETWRTERLDTVTDNIRRYVDDLLLWWAEAREQLGQPLDPEDRRRTVRRGLTEVFMVRTALDGLEELLRDAARGDALAGADEDVRQLVLAAARWNDAWVLQEALRAGEIFDPLDNPDGFCEELRGRLADPNARLD